MMNSYIISGSPKSAKCSVTCQTVHYLPKRYPQHHYAIIDVGAWIRLVEKDPSPTMEVMARCDILLFAYAVETQYKVKGMKGSS